MVGSILILFFLSMLDYKPYIFRRASFAADGFGLIFQP